jgi:hypothetical protein
MIGGLNLAGDGTMYIDNNDQAAGSHQLLRCVNMGAPADAQLFVGLKGTTSAASDFGNTANLPPASTTIIYNATAYPYNLIYQIIGSTANGTTVNGYPFQVKKFTDTMVAKPVISAPAADAQVPSTFAITWGAIGAGGQTVTYSIDVATDAAFANKVVAGQTTTATTYYVTPVNTPQIIQGLTYWVRVAATAPYPTPNSAAVKFAVQLGQTGNTDLAKDMSPLPGATDVPVNATFQWSAVTGASSYHIQVADNPGFTDPLADATTADTFFTLSSALKAGTVYYWRVQAISGQVASAYVSRVFTTAAPVAPTTATTTQPPQTVQPTIIVTIPPTTPAPVQTPGYVWAIIAIGAVLVIAVIVLIARTRRV